MNQLTAIQKTMSSKELLDVINKVRIEMGEPTIRLNKFNEKIEDELDGEHYTKSVVQNLNNITKPKQLRITWVSINATCGSSHND